MTCEQKVSVFEIAAHYIYTDEVFDAINLADLGVTRNTSLYVYSPPIRNRSSNDRVENTM